MQSDSDGRPESVLDRIDRPVFALDDSWRFTYVNDGAEDLLDASANSLHGRVIWDVLSGLMSTSVPQTLHQAVESGESTSVTVGMTQGREVSFEAYPGDGGLTVLLTDVTDQRRQERRFRRYEAAFNAADDPIYVLGPDGRIREVNDAMVAFTGYTRDELLGERFSLLIDSEELERAEQRIRETLLEDDESVGTIEVDVTTADGSRHTCAVSVALLSTPDGMNGTVGVMRDVTDQHQREQRLSVLDRVLRHNIRNEMNVVIGRAEAAKHGVEDPEIEDHLDRILTKAEDLVGISQDIRRFSDALDPGIGSAKPRDATEAVTAIVEDLQEWYPEAEIRVTVATAAWMYAHQSVFAAIEELLENAIEHHDRDHPQIHVTIDADGPPGPGEVTIAIADDGPGLPEIEQDVLTGGDETPLTHASGIGLWLVNWAVSKSGGHLSFSENDPRGSVVRIHLQRTSPPSSDEGAEAIDDDDGETANREDGRTRNANGDDTPNVS